MILLHKVNQLTHWIDASNVYGSAVEETNRLRRFKDGLLRVHVNPDGSELLPDSGDPECRGRYDNLTDNVLLVCLIFRNDILI